MSDNKSELNVLGLALKHALKDESDALKTVVRLRQNVEGLTLAIKTLGGDPVKVADTAKTPRTTNAMIKDAEAAVESVGGAPATQTEPETPAAETPAAETPAAETPAAEAINPDDEARKTTMADVRETAATLAKDFKYKDKIKGLLKEKGYEKFDEVPTDSLVKLGAKLKKTLKTLQEEAKAAAEAAKTAEAEKPLPEDDW